MLMLPLIEEEVLPVALMVLVCWPPDALPGELAIVLLQS